MADLSQAVQSKLQQGTVIPAMPLALKRDRSFDVRRQRALVRYYMAAGAGGLAVGVHSTQFAIRHPDVNLLKPVLATAMEEMLCCPASAGFIKVAGICGPTDQAVEEARLAAELGYDMGLLSMGGLQSYSEGQLLARARAVGQVLPLFGFYLQPQVGGRVLSYDFWLQFAELPSVKAIKMAPFDRYLTLDVVRAVCHSSRAEDIALYTGNDDNIVADLLTEYRFDVGGRQVTKPIVGGLLGHWAIWTRRAVELLADVRKARASGSIPQELLWLGQQITDVNAAIFDPHHGFAGCIPGIHEVLRRQGLLDHILCLDPDEKLSPGQLEQIDRVYASYPDLNDDAFVRENVEQWLA